MMINPAKFSMKPHDESFGSCHLMINRNPVMILATVVNL